VNNTECVHCEFLLEKINIEKRRKKLSIENFRDKKNDLKKLKNSLKDN